MMQGIFYQHHQQDIQKNIQVNIMSGIASAIRGSCVPDFAGYCLWIFSMVRICTQAIAEMTDSTERIPYNNRNTESIFAMKDECRGGK